MLIAARRLFARDSYENVGVRDIAREVGVDPALVIRYFGSKEELFREILHSGKASSLLEGVSAQELPARLVSLIVEQEDDCDEANAKLERILIILRSASSSQASAIVHEATDKIIVEPIASLLGAPDARLRACLALMILSGSGIMKRQMLDAKHAGDAADGALKQRLLALFETALAETPPQAG